MTDRKKIALAFALVALVIGGGSYYFFAIHRPQQVRGDARDEVVAWETRWQAARACLLGAHPASSKTSEALAVREMTIADDALEGSCAALVGKLVRGPAPDTSLPAVEQAWRELDVAAQHAARGYTGHLKTSAALVRDRLPDALDELDAARAALRDAAGLPAAVLAGAPLPAAKLVALPDRDDPITTLELTALPSAGTLVAFGRTARREVQVVFVAGAPPSVMTVAASGVRAVPDPSWGAIGDADGALRVGAMDDAGAIARPARLALHGPVTVAAAMGTLARGVVVYGTPTEAAIARVDHGAATAGPPLPIDVAMATAAGDGHGAFAWSRGDATSAQLVAAAATVPASPLVAGARIASLCVTRDAAWIATTTGAVVALDAARSWRARGPAPGSALVGCTAAVAVMREREPGRFAVCARAGATCRAAALPGAPTDAAISAVGDQLVGVAAHAGVLGVWREASPPRFFALPEPASPVLAREWPAMALADGETLDVVGRSARGFVVIRIPAR